MLPRQTDSQPMHQRPQPYTTPTLTRYGKPSLVAHGSLTDMTQSNYGEGGDGGQTQGYTSSIQPG